MVIRASLVLFLSAAAPPPSPQSIKAMEQACAAALPASCTNQGRL
jgi:hypothetical protein